jgi:hypothetical protein
MEINKPKISRVTGGGKKEESAKPVYNLEQQQEHEQKTRSRKAPYQRIRKKASNPGSCESRNGSSSRGRAGAAGKKKSRRDRRR